MYPTVTYTIHKFKSAVMHRDKRKSIMKSLSGTERKIYIFLFSFFPVGRGTLLQVSPITAGPFVQVCSGGGNSPQHRH